MWFYISHAHAYRVVVYNYVPINYLPHYPPLGLCMGKTRGFDSVLNERLCAPGVGNLTWPSIWPLNFRFVGTEWVGIWFQWVFFHPLLSLVFSFKCIRKIKSSYILLLKTRVRRGFNHLTCLNGGIFDHLFGQIPTGAHASEDSGTNNW